MGAPNVRDLVCVFIVESGNGADGLAIILRFADGGFFAVHDAAGTLEVAVKLIWDKLNILSYGASLSPQDFVFVDMSVRELKFPLMEEFAAP